MSLFAAVEQVSPPETHSMSMSFREDEHPRKVNLGIGVYQSDAGEPWVLPVVRSVESLLAADVTLHHDYQPISGTSGYGKSVVKLLLGHRNHAVLEGRVSSLQTVGGTGALRIGLEYLTSRLGYTTAYVSNPTWGPHKSLLRAVKFEKVLEYRYWHVDRRNLDIEGLLADLQNAPENSVIILQVCAHNPTGVNPTREQWILIAEVMKRRKLFPFMDLAYQGFESGDSEVDVWPLRYFVEQGFELFVAQSFSKNFGLYGERCGNLIVISSTGTVMDSLRSHLEMLCCSMWGMASAHGSRIISAVLNDADLYSQWKQNLNTMTTRITNMRRLLLERLTSLKVTGDWSHVVKQRGMFCYTGLNERQIDTLKRVYHIYALRCGRINIGAVTSRNVDYVAASIAATVRDVQ